MLARGLAAVWPKARRHVVQVGRDLTQREVACAQVHRYPLAFGKVAKITPPFDSDPHHDAKAWEVCLARHRSERVVFWNVAPTAR